ncbi:MAG: hypothetical protein K6U10_14285 [Acidobacteriia bacterium]|nr:hypothetical protein [Methyloceanibacter sp.]MCL6492970.1 hypothetical protein [Terriglobia bacterium]
MLRFAFAKSSGKKTLLRLRPVILLGILALPLAGCFVTTDAGISPVFGPPGYAGYGGYGWGFGDDDDDGGWGFGGDDGWGFGDDD